MITKHTLVGLNWARQHGKEPHFSTIFDEYWWQSEWAVNRHFWPNSIIPDKIFDKMGSDTTLRSYKSLDDAYSALGKAIS